MRGSTTPVYTRHAPPNPERRIPFFRLVSVILRITAQPVLLQYLKTVVDGPRNRNVEVRAGTCSRAGSGPARGAALRATQPARRITASNR